MIVKQLNAMRVVVSTFVTVTLLLLLTKLSLTEPISTTPLNDATTHEGFPSLPTFCVDGIRLPVESNNSEYLECVGGYWIRQRCPVGYVFDPRLELCRYSHFL